MRKITLLFSLLISTISFAQGPWEFNNEHVGWVEAGCSVSDGATAVVLTTNGTDNPTFGIDVTNSAVAGINADVNKFAEIRLKNSANGPTFLRFSYPNGTGGRVYKFTTISTGDTEFKTYYIDLTNSNWVGTVDDIKLHFKTDNGTNGGANYNTTGETIEIDRVAVVQFPERYSYEFNTDAENWTENNSTISVNAGILTVNPTIATSGKIVQSVFAVNTTNATWVHIVYKNNSANNNRIRFQFRYAGDAYTAYKGTNMNVNQNMSGFETLSIDLSAIAEWTGITKDFQIIIQDTNNSGNASSAGTFEIESVLFNTSSTLGTETFAYNENFSCYPNPTVDNLSFSSQSMVESVVVYDITGKQMLAKQQLVNNTIDVSQLNAGLYLAQVNFTEGKTTILKFIKR